MKKEEIKADRLGDKSNKMSWDSTVKIHRTSKKEREK